MKNNYDIVVLAGQSNAIGCGIGPVDTPYVINEDIEMLYDAQSCNFVENANGESVLSLNRNWNLKIETAHEHECKGEKVGNLALSFCNEYIKEGNLASDRKMLIINTAVGGTGFTKRHWGQGEILNDRMFYMIDYALKENKNNRLIAILWHQGEHDAFEQAEKHEQPQHIFDYYKGKLQSLMVAIKNKYGDIPFIAGEFCREWWNKNKPQCDAVLDATRQSICELKNGAVVSSMALISNNQKVKNGDDLHFCRQSLQELGKRYYKAYSKLR